LPNGRVTLSLAAAGATPAAAAARPATSARFSISRRFSVNLVVSEVCNCFDPSCGDVGAIAFACGGWTADDTDNLDPPRRCSKRSPWL
jgi:hypothetical protein